MAAPSGETGGRSTGRRLLCEHCARPLTACWCGCIRVVDNRTRLVILQDPDEATQAKGTAALLARCLTNVELRIGERFAPLLSVGGCVLLYPETPAHTAQTTAALHAAPHEPVTLIALDGTWRRSRKLLYSNPWLQALPRLSLAALPPSRYAIRRAQDATQRSTLEACALALAQLDGEPSRYEPLWRAMDEFVALQRRLADNPPSRGGSVAR